MRRAWLLFPLAVLLAGCGPKINPFGGKMIRLPTSEISISPNTTEILMSLTDSQKVKGRSASCNFPSIVNSLPVFATVKPDYEKLKMAKPDLVFYDASIYSPTDIAKLKEVMGEHSLYEFHSKTIDEFETQLREVGVITDSAINMSQYIDKIEGERTAAKTANLGPGPKIAAISGTLISGTKDFLADAIRNAGGQPSGPDVDQFVEINPETLIQSDPDIILLAVQMPPTTLGIEREKRRAAMEKGVAAFLADPRYKAMKAVKSKNVFPVDADVMLRAGSRVDQLIHAIAAGVGVWESTK